MTVLVAAMHWHTLPGAPMNTTRPVSQCSVLADFLQRTLPGWPALKLARSLCRTACCTQSQSPARLGSRCRCCRLLRCGDTCVAWT